MADFPHLARDGAVLTAYDPARSTFVRTMFFLDAGQLEDGWVTVDDLRDAGINAFTSGVYMNPVTWGDAVGPPITFERWKDTQERWLRPQLDRIRDAGMLLLAGGDSIARRQVERDLTLRGRAPRDDGVVEFPHGRAAVEYTVRMLAEFGGCVGCDMVDEADMFFGSPTTDDVRTLREWMAPLPIAWPILGNASPETAQAWMGHGSPSDYASIFYNKPPGNDWPAFPDRHSYTQFFLGWEKTLVGWGLGDRARLMIADGSGHLYLKREASAYYVPGVDRLDNPAVPPEMTLANIFHAVARGACGLRVYGLEPSYEYRERNGEGRTGMQLQTMCHPRIIGVDRWAAMRAGFRFIEANEDLCLAPVVPVDDPDPFVALGVRESDAGRLTILVNCSERTWSGYVAAKGERCRYTGGVLSDTTPAARAGTVSLPAGDSMTWVDR